MFILSNPIFLLTKCDVLAPWMADFISCCNCSVHSDEVCNSRETKHQILWVQILDLTLYTFYSFNSQSQVLYGFSTQFVSMETCFCRKASAPGVVRASYARPDAGVALSLPTTQDTATAALWGTLSVTNPYITYVSAYTSILNIKVWLNDDQSDRWETGAVEQH